jgi:hypothetical protein
MEGSTAAGEVLLRLACAGCGGGEGNRQCDASELCKNINEDA